MLKKMNINYFKRKIAPKYTLTLLFRHWEKTFFLGNPFYYKRTRERQIAFHNFEPNIFLTSHSLTHFELGKQKSQMHKSKSNQSENEQNSCVVCQENPRQLALVPCGHYVTCVVCGHGLKSCPKCSSDITGLIRIFD